MAAYNAVYMLLIWLCLIVSVVGLIINLHGLKPRSVPLLGMNILLLIGTATALFVI